MPSTARDKLQSTLPAAAHDAGGSRWPARQVLETADHVMAAPACWHPARTGAAGIADRSPAGSGQGPDALTRYSAKSSAAPDLRRSVVTAVGRHAGTDA